MAYANGWNADEIREHKHPFVMYDEDQMNANALSGNWGEGVDSIYVLRNSAYRNRHCPEGIVPNEEDIPHSDRNLWATLMVSFNF